MRAEDFQLTQNETIDNSITKRDFIEIYHQHVVRVNDEIQIFINFPEKIPTINKNGMLI